PSHSVQPSHPRLRFEVCSFAWDSSRAGLLRPTMPLVNHSTYRCPLFLGNGHVQTCLPNLVRRVNGITYRRERIPTADGDFLDLDWRQTGSKRVAVLTHGLEGDSKRHYMLGMVKALARRGWDALAWNARGCSGEPNRVLRFTHSGATEDLQTVLTHLFS